jgi:hypothetical protein
MTTQDIVSIYILTIGLFVISLLIWLFQRQRSGKGFILWLASGIVGILLGSVGSFAAINLAGYKVIEPITKAPPPAYVPPSTARSAAEAAPVAPMVPVGSANSPAGGAGPAGGGPGAANPKRDLSTLVRKLDVLTDDVAIQLTAEQSAALIKGLAGVDQAEKLSNDDAKVMHDELIAILTDEQKTKLDKAGALMGRGGPGGGRGPGGGGPGGGGPGGGQQDPDANPFQQENNLKALQSFRARFDGAKPAPPADAAADGK